jgi:hypothetical protein
MLEPVPPEPLPPFTATVKGLLGVTPAEVERRA